MGGTLLSRLIGSHESYGGNYGAFNRGGSNNGHTAHGSGIDPNLVNMTIAEIQRRQLAPGVPRSQQLHAVGKYQIIGSTLQGLMQGRYGATGVSMSDRFTPEVQERLGYLLARNRVQGVSVEQGMRGLRQEWIGLQYANTAKLRQAVIELQNSSPGQWFGPTTAPAFDAAGQAASLQNSIESNANSIRDNAALIQRTTEALERLNNVLIPNLVQTQSLQAETLTTSQRACLLYTSDAADE